MIDTNCPPVEEKKVETYEVQCGIAQCRKTFHVKTIEKPGTTIRTRCAHCGMPQSLIVPETAEDCSK